MDVVVVVVVVGAFGLSTGGAGRGLVVAAGAVGAAAATPLPPVRSSNPEKAAMPRPRNVKRIPPAEPGLLRA